MKKRKNARNPGLARVRAAGHPKSAASRLCAGIATRGRGGTSVVFAMKTNPMTSARKCCHTRQNPNFETRNPKQITKRKFPKSKRRRHAFGRYAYPTSSLRDCVPMTSTRGRRRGNVFPFGAFYNANRPSHIHVAPVHVLSSFPNHPRTDKRNSYKSASVLLSMQTMFSFAQRVCDECATR